jgi:autotransporter-associated beta strand protein
MTIMQSLLQRRSLGDKITYATLRSGGWTFLLTAVAVLTLLLSAASNSFAGSATWDPNPVSSDWNTASNWTLATVPNSSTDTATFGSSNTTAVSISETTDVSGVTFTTAANPYTITVPASSSLNGITLSFDGAGITNNSGVAQNFVLDGATNALSGRNEGTIMFNNSATAGNGAFTTNSASPGSVPPGGQSAGGRVLFSNTSTAGNGTFANNGAVISGVGRGSVFFSNTSTAGNGTFTNNGGLASGAAGGIVTFFDTSTAGNATIINNGGAVGGALGGITQFSDDSTGGTSRIELFGNGELDISSHNAPGVTMGSIEGTGNVFLGANNLTVGSNNLSTSLSGVIQDGGAFGGVGGSLTKIGSGTLELTRVELYTGKTTINDGVLKVNGVIIGPVTVNNGGTLGGRGATGMVTVNSGGTVAPGDPQTLHVNGDYLQNGGGILRIDIGGTAPGSFDQLMATGGVTLLSGSILDLDFINGFAPQTGDVFEFLTSGTSSITGTFTTVNIEGLQPGFEFDLAPTGNGSFGLTALNNGVPASTPDTSSTVMLLLLGLTPLLGVKHFLAKLH